MGKSSRFKTTYAANASNFHKNFGDYIKQSPLFKNYKIYQEYPVKKINPSFYSNRHHFDWYVKDLNLVIELHGQQHVAPVCFGGISIEEAERKLARQKVIDALKRDAAENANATYIVIFYDEEYDDQILLEKIESANANLKITTEPTSEAVIADQQEIDPNKELELEKERKRKRMEAKERASERRRIQREQIKQSKAYKERKIQAKAFRKAKYQALKEKIATKKKTNG